MAGWEQREKEHLSSLLLHGPSLLALTLPLGATAERTVNKFAAYFLEPMLVVESLIPIFRSREFRP